MVQVGCTINYGRTGLWKEIEESFFATESPGTEKKKAFLSASMSPWLSRVWGSR
jgi:hypothetical protein